MDSSPSPVFHDPEGRRWRHVRRTWLLLSIGITALAAIFIASVLANPALPTFNLRQLRSLPRAVELKPKSPDIPANPSETKARKAHAELQRALASVKNVPGKRRTHVAIVPPPLSLPTPSIPTSRPLSVGFYINWDESSYESLKRNLDHLDWVIPEWIHLQDQSTSNSVPITTDIHAPVLNWIRQTRPQVRILPMVQNVINEKFDGTLLSRAVADESHRQQLINSLLAFVQDNQFGGVCVDFEEPPATSQATLLTFMQELYSVFGSPVMDLMLVYVLVAAALDRLEHPSGYSSANLQQVLFYYALFLAIDWLSACFAFLLERKERWSLLWWLFLQRFCYRQVMYYVMIKSVAMAIRGPVVGWGKLERKATAEARP